MSLFTEIQSRLSKQIYSMRLSKGWSLEKLAYKLNTSRAQITRLETSKLCNPRLDTLIKIAKVHNKKLIIIFT